MAIRNDKRIGRTRFQLAQLIAEAFPELKASRRQRNYGGTPRLCVDPFLLTPQIPIYASPMYDCCSWDADLPMKDGGSLHIYSWDRMGDLVRAGFDYTREHREIELSCKERPST